MSGDIEIDELGILNTIISSLKPLDRETQTRLLQSAITFLRLEADLLPRSTSRQVGPTDATVQRNVGAEFGGVEIPGGPFSNRPNISPKEFLLDKDPRSDVERVVCLAYYLTHYRNTREFKTLDISKLNTESAHVKFSNPAYAVDNATRAGFLVPATRGMKQLGALGEQYVNALPDREAAKAVRAKVRRRTRKSVRPSSQEAPDEDGESS